MPLCSKICLCIFYDADFPIMFLLYLDLWFCSVLVQNIQESTSVQEPLKIRVLVALWQICCKFCNNFLDYSRSGFWASFCEFNLHLRNFFNKNANNKKIGIVHRNACIPLHRNLKFGSFVTLQQKFNHFIRFLKFLKSSKKCIFEQNCWKFEKWINFLILRFIL